MIIINNKSLVNNGQVRQLGNVLLYSDKVRSNKHCLFFN